MAIQALIFDFDGVLADSVEIKTKAFAKLFESFGDVIVDKVIKHHLENGGMDRNKKIKYYFKHFLDEKIDNKIINSYCMKFSKLVVENVISSPEIKGAKNFLECCYNNIPCFINSATPDSELIEIIERRELKKYFKDILGSNENKIVNLKLILKKYNLNIKKCIFFGDSINDYIAANELSIPFIGVVSKSSSKLAEVRPKIKFIKDFTQINLLNLKDFI